MSIFKGHKVSASQLLDFIPEALLTHLSTQTKIDYYSKVLHGKKMFYLLLYGILDNEKLSQRTLEDTFNDSVFKLLFNLDKSEKVCRSSISERLSKIDSSYFKEIFDFIYEQFSSVYGKTESDKYNLIRVDSTMVTDVAGKLKEGIDQKSGKKLLKYSISFDGILPSSLEVFDKQKYSAEDNALPESILKHVMKDTNHSNIYIIDRGVQSTRTMKKFSEKTIPFVIRSKENRKHIELESLIKENQNLDLGELELIKDSIVNFYTGTPINNKKGRIHYREELMQQPFRLIVARKKPQQDKIFWLITNDFDLSAKEVTDFYRRRWDIEVFFRFIKQELNVSHLVSLNKNGIKVIIYMTLIVAMLLLIYKKANNISYKTAKRRFKIEIRNLAIAMIVVLAGGNPNIMLET
jgi:hypothetical protein